MASQVPSESQTDSGILNRVFGYFRGLAGIFLLCTVFLVGYTLIEQHGCTGVVWWQQSGEVSCWQTEVTPQSLELKLGEAATLNAQVNRTGHYSPEIHWKTQKENIAFLDQNEGKQIVVQAKEVGTTEILVSIGVENQNSSENSANFKIPIEVLPSLTITPQALRIEEGSGKQFNVNIGGIGPFGNKSVAWQVANPDLIEIDKNNLVKALKPGNTTLTAVWSKDSRVNQTIEVAVIENPPQITEIQIQSDSDLFYVGETDHFNAEASCEGNCTTEDTQILWSSNYPNRATISADGDLKALEPGEVILAATSIIDEKQSRSMAVKILDPIVTDISLQPSSVKVAVNSQKPVQATLNGRGYFNKLASWTSEDPEIAQVDNDGVVTGIKEGKTMLHARSISHPDQVAEAEVTVKSGGCSSGIAVSIGSAVTVGTAALLVPPPIAVAAGSAAASGLCWIIDKVN